MITQHLPSTPTSKYQSIQPYTSITAYYTSSLPILAVEFQLLVSVGQLDLLVETDGPPSTCRNRRAGSVPICTPSNAFHSGRMVLMTDDFGLAGLLHIFLLVIDSALD